MLSESFQTVFSFEHRVSLLESRSFFNPDSDDQTLIYSSPIHVNSCSSPTPTLQLLSVVGLQCCFSLKNGLAVSGNFSLLSSLLQLKSIWIQKPLKELNYVLLKFNAKSQSSLRLDLRLDLRLRQFERQSIFSVIRPMICGRESWRLLRLLFDWKTCKLYNVKEPVKRQLYSKSRDWIVNFTMWS